MIRSRVRIPARLRFIFAFTRCMRYYSPCADMSPAARGHVAPRAGCKKKRCGDKFHETRTLPAARGRKCFQCTSQRWGASARAHVHAPFPYLANGEDCVQVWYMATDSLDRALHKSEVGCICTCARARPFSISRKRLDGLRSNLVCGERPIR